MGEHKHGAPRAKRPRGRSHPVTLAIGLLIVAAVVTAVVLTVRFLYSDYSWHTSARDSASAIAESIQHASEIDESTPVPVDAVASNPSAGQVTISSLPYAKDISPDVARVRLSAGGGLSVVMTSGALCSGITFNMTTPGKSPTGTFACGDQVAPPVPTWLTATPRDATVILEWQHPPEPVEDYEVSYSQDGGAHWSVVDDGVSSLSRADVRDLVNGHPYLFRVAAVNMAGRSATASASASPFTRPAPPTNVHATGGFTTVVSWTPAKQDGGRPVTEYIVEGIPTGRCVAVAPATQCEITDLPAAADYTFLVRAVNDAGPGAPSSTSSEAVAVYSVPGRPVALEASPGDSVVLLTWTKPLLDGNTPITNYQVEYKVSAGDEWVPFDHPASAATAITVNGLTNGTEYDFRVMAVNAAGVSAPPLTDVSQTPATVPDPVESLLEADANASVTLAWTAPAFDGGAPITDYLVQYLPEGGQWTTVEETVSTDPQIAVTGLVNGVRYSFRVAAVNAMGTGRWAARVTGSPFTVPGPITEPIAVGSPTAIELSWLPPADDGGRPVKAYAIHYKATTAPDWLALKRVPARLTAATITGLVQGESYDIRISAISEGGAGPSGLDGSDVPTLTGVIAEETPPAPTGLTAVAGDGSITLTWRASPAGPDSPITAYTVSGTPSGTCTTRKKLSCVIPDLPTGVEYAFTITASNAFVTGLPSDPVQVNLLAYNSATGGVVTTYTRGGRTFRVHTFLSGAPLTITSAAQPFDVLVVGAGGGSSTNADGTTAVGAGGAVTSVKRATLRPGQWSVVVGAGGAPGAPGSTSSLDGVGAAAGGPPGTVPPVAATSAVTSSLSGVPVTYGGAGTPTSGPGIDGRGSGAGGPTANRGGNGVVIVRYEVASQ